MIELQNLTKRYGSTLAVDGLTFSVPEGRVTGFLGPNGAGKSTTMRMMLGLDNPSAGEVRIDGHPYRQLHAPLREIGALLEAKAVHPGRTAYNHLLCLAQSNRIPRKRVSEVLELVGLGEVAKKRTKGFSLGMSQRLGIAAALLGDPRIALFDEPVNGLDPEGILWVRNLMKRLAADGRTVFVSSHLMSEMALTAEHLIVIGRGRLLADLPMNEFIRRNSRSYVRVRTPQGERMQDVLAALPGARVTGAADGSLEVEEAEAAAIGEAAAAAGIPLHELSPQSASLEEAFMQLTAESVQYHAGTGEPPQAPPGIPPGTPPGMPPGTPPPPAPGGWMGNGNGEVTR
ncbi:multidrug ABC transporter ATP-binding protein [Mangrovactinospora gilvigrisea]|uniref:Multidrug ABC transporter ATP-binding protein n=1 Tax=Mangrovactinospora gilvigrisea TaxID=1428644 RepID=A0A1J7BBG0_9ACTN|nr:ATP-binding cassette domain-containing protein [Mangrovactinospora gilvigrisea]OIV35941.1 multidrug ABC transporter ATP-binding protein [Mangrovactinospora gilvigrisea]